MKKRDVFHRSYLIFASDLDRAATSQIGRNVFLIMQIEVNNLWSIEITFFMII